MAPSLIGVTGRMTDVQIIAKARQVGRTMCCARSILDLSDSQLHEITAFLHAADSSPNLSPRQEKAGGSMGCCSMMSSVDDAAVIGSTLTEYRVRSRRGSTNRAHLG